jgi:hypothetical protein
MTPQEEKNLCLLVITRLLPGRLQDDGLYPFGATLGSNRNINLLVPTSMRKSPTRDELESYWIKQLQESVTKSQGDCKAACFCMAVLIPATNGEMVPAVMVYLDHITASAEDIFYPYWKDEHSKFVLGEPISSPAACRIFISS